MEHDMIDQNKIIIIQQELIDSIIPGGIVGGYLEVGRPFYYISQNMLTYLGYHSQQEFVKDIEGKLVNGVHQEDLLQVERECVEQLEHKENYEIQYRMRKKDGSYIWVHDTGKKFQTEDGREVIISICYDVTREKEQNTFLQNFMDSMNGSMGIYKVSEKGCLSPVYVSDSMGRMIGMTKEEYQEICREDAMACIHPEDQDRLREALLDTIQYNRPNSITFRSRTHDGTYMWLNGSYSKSMEVDGEPAIRVVFTPASTQFQLQQDVIHNMPGGVCLYKWEKNKLKPLIISDKFAKLHGGDDKEQEKISGVDYEYVHPEDLDGYLEFIHRIVQQPGKERFHTFRFWNQLEKRYVWIGVNTTDVEQPDKTLLIYASYSNVDQIKEAEEKLKRNERMLEETCSFAGVWTFVYDIPKRIAYPGKTLQEAFGLQPEEKDFPECMLRTEFIPEESKKQYREMVKRVEQGEDSFKTDIVIQYTSEERHWLRYEWKIMEREGTRPKIAIGYARNVDEEKQLEARIKMEQERLLGGDGTLLAYIVSDINQNRIVEHKTFLQQDPLTRVGELLETGSVKGSEDIIDLDKKLEFRKNHNCLELLRRYADGTSSMTMEYRRKYQNGVIGWERNVLNILREPESGSLYLYEYCYDINKEKLLEETMIAAVNYNYEQFGSINLEADQISMLLPEKAASDYEMRVESYSGFCRNYAVQYVIPEDQGLFLQSEKPTQLAANLKETGAFEFIHREIGSDGMIHYKQNRYVYYDKEKKICLLTRSDVTQMVQEEEKKQQDLKRALEKEKEAAKAKSDFLSRMSHELRTPLNAIAGYTTLLEQNAKQKEDQEELALLDSIQHANRYLLAIIGDILDCQKTEAGHIELVKDTVLISEYMTHIVEMIQPEADQKGIRFTYERLTRFSEYYYMDGVRLQQVLLNILHNAIKFTDRGGSVHLQAESIETIRDREQKENARQKQRSMTLRFTISDTGIGMSREFVEHGLFQPFSQENHDITSPYEGTGIGLSISKELVNLMDGEIICSSEKGTGTTFVVTVQVKAAERPARRQRRKGKEQLEEDLSGIRILVCEDNPMNQDMTRRLLERMHCEVEVADDGAIGVERFRQSEAGYYDMILMDLRMPVMDGFEATVAMRSLNRSDAATIPIVALSANAFEEDVKLSLAAGMNEHLAKPVDARVLGEKIRYYCKAKREKTE